MYRKIPATTDTPQSPDAKPDGDRRWAVLRQDLHRRLIQSIDHAVLRNMDEAKIRQQLRIGAEELCRSRSELLSPDERRRLIDEVVDDTLGFGPLEQLLSDDTVSDILINGAETIYVERNGQLEKAAIAFHSEEHLLATVQKIVARVGRRIDESSPMVDARLPDGSRVNAIIAPLALDGALVSIRRFRAATISAEDMIASGSLSLDMLLFLKMCVVGRASILVSGGTGSGKTTLLNLLSSYIPHNERVVTIEDTAELRLQQPHVARLETRPPNLEGAGQVTTCDLLRNALRMRPDRIVIGECRGREAFDMLQAMNTGHDGSLTTIHANSTRDAISRLEMLVGLSGVEMSPAHIAKQIAASVNVVIQVTRFPDGQRKIVQISEVDGVHQGEVQLSDLFSFDETDVDEDGRTCGQFRKHSVEPRILRKARARALSSQSTGFDRSLSEVD